MIFFGEECSTRCSHSAISIGNNIFPNGIIEITVYSIVQEIHISILELQRWPLEFLGSFCTVKYIFRFGIEG
jgi:hypothetical protein